MRCLRYDICKRLDIPVFSDEDEKPQAPSHVSSRYWLVGDIKEPRRLAKSRGRSSRCCGLPQILKLVVSAKSPSKKNCKLFNAKCCQAPLAKINMALQKYHSFIHFLCSFKRVLKLTFSLSDILVITVIARNKQCRFVVLS